MENETMPICQPTRWIPLLIAHERVDTRLWSMLDFLAVPNGTLMRHVTTIRAIAS